MLFPMSFDGILPFFIRSCFGGFDGLKMVFLWSLEVEDLDPTIQSVRLMELLVEIVLPRD
jgi:hypothetical protein